MAQSSRTTHRLVLIQIKGGSPFQISIPGNPTIVHNGGSSIHTVLITSEDMEILPLQIQQFASVTFRELEGENEEQRKERTKLLNLHNEDAEWPTIRCGECFWFDPRNEYPCLAGDFDPPSAKAKQDLELCPLSKEKTHEEPCFSGHGNHRTRS